MAVSIVVVPQTAPQLRAALSSCGRGVRGRAARVARVLVGCWCTLLVLAMASPAWAYFGPLRQHEGAWFPTAVTGLQLVHARLDATHIPGTGVAAGQAGGQGTWLVDGQLVVRNPSSAPRSLTLLVPDDDAWRGETVVWVQGQVQYTQERQLRLDPGMPQHSYPRASVVEVVLPAETLVTLRATWVQSGRTDSLGRQQLRVASHLLGLWGEAIPTADLRVQFTSRPVALQTTLSGHTLYDEPQNEVGWYVRDWRPSIPLELAWLTPWSALLIVATVEQCPDPIQVVARVTGGDPSALQTMLQTHTPEDLAFCASLPLVLHGMRFPDENVRRDLARLTVARYVPGAPDGPSLYVENAQFSEGMLSEVEGLYRRGLRLVLPGTRVGVGE